MEPTEHLEVAGIRGFWFFPFHEDLHVNPSPLNYIAIAALHTSNHISLDSRGQICSLCGCLALLPQSAPRMKGLYEDSIKIGMCGLLAEGDANYCSNRRSDTEQLLLLSGYYATQQPLNHTATNPMSGSRT
eukprot:scaffold119809_cov102-Cyclotella_meneghiniana.AAC.3